jgi:hypothetical protein
MLRVPPPISSWAFCWPTARLEKNATQQNKIAEARQFAPREKPNGRQILADRRFDWGYTSEDGTLGFD